MTAPYVSAVMSAFGVITDMAFALHTSRSLFGRRDLLQHAALGFDADCPQRDRGDQERQREGVQHVGAEPVLQHEADDGRRQERADPADAEEPADRGRAQVRRIKLADIDAGRAVDAGIDPADRGDGEINPHAGCHREPQMEERADEIIEEQHRPAADSGRSGSAHAV